MILFYSLHSVDWIGIEDWLAFVETLFCCEIQPLFTPNYYEYYYLIVDTKEKII